MADEYTKKGLGTRMLNHLVDFARNCGQSTMSLSVDNDNAAAQKLYTRFGFIKTKQGENYIFMELGIK